jgi:hypothetical protein
MYNVHILYTKIFLLTLLLLQDSLSFLFLSVGFSCYIRLYSEGYKRLLKFVKYILFNTTFFIFLSD